MANTFTMIGPNGAFPGATKPNFSEYVGVTAPAVPPPGTGYNGSNAAGAYVPIEPLPGNVTLAAVPL